MTLNLAQVDWIGTTILPFLTSLLGAGFLGWGRAVRTNPAKLRGGLNGLAVVSLAGPFSNVIMAVMLAVLAVATLSALPALAQFLAHGVELSLYLAIINMLPVPPLDGSKLLLAARVPAVVYVELSSFGFMLLIVLISVTRLGILMSDWSYLGTRAIFSLLH